MTDWNRRFLELARHISQWSKDRSTKVGAVIVDQNNRILSVGYNGFPAGCNDDVESRHERPKKYLYTEHAERNAIYSAALNGISLWDKKMYITQYPCADCARGIVQSGIKTIYCPDIEFEEERWKKSYSATKDILKETFTKIIFINE